MKIHLDLRGKDVCLLGSAPGGMPEPGMTLVCVNGSSLTYPALVPDVLFVNTASFDRNATANLREHQRVMRCRHLVIVERREMRSPPLIQRERLSIISNAQRAADLVEMLPPDVHAALGDTIPSTGARALLYVLRAQPASVTVRGFSLKGGHSYLPGVATERRHVAPDSLIFDYVRRTHPNVTGLPAAPGDGEGR